MILQPGGVVGVLMQILRGYKMVLTTDHSSQTGEKTFRQIGAFAVVAEHFAVIDTLHFPALLKGVPVSRFISRNDRRSGDMLLDQRNTIRFAHGHKRQRSAATFAHHNDKSSLAVLMFFEASVNAIFGMIGRTNMTTKLCAIKLDMAFKLRPDMHCFGHCLAKFMGQNEGCLGRECPEEC